MRTWLGFSQVRLLTLFGLATLPVVAQVGVNCVSCNHPIRSGAIWLQSQMRLDPQPVCKDCVGLSTRCAICKLPLKQPFKELKDGRWLCQADAAKGIFSETEAQRFFERLKGELFPLFSGLGALPHRNITLRLADTREIALVVKSTGSENQPHGPDPMAFARSRQRGQGSWEHEIYVLEALSEPQLAAILSHEYTHLWLRENLPSTRRLTRTTLEGFCEMVAYQIVERRGDELHKRVILANAYTRGKVQVFLEAKEKYQFHRIVKWIKSGVDLTISSQNLERLLVLEKKETVEAPVLASLERVQTPVPDKLTLKGISGVPGRRFALINDRTLQENEEATVRVGQDRVRLRCLEIGERSAHIQVEGQPGPITLQLGAPPQ